MCDSSFVPGRGVAVFDTTGVFSAVICHKARNSPTHETDVQVLVVRPARDHRSSTLHSPGGARAVGL